jgi:hypothetical protein
MEETASFRLARQQERYMYESFGGKVCPNTPQMDQPPSQLKGNASFNEANKNSETSTRTAAT